MSWLLRALVLADVIFASLALWEQPRMGDDWNFAWILADTGSLWKFLVESYLDSSGRLLPYALVGLALSSETASRVFQLLAVPCFLVFAVCAHYLATGTIPRPGRAEGSTWLLTAAVLWLGLPVVSDTIVQTTGATAYLWSPTAGLALLCLFRNARDRVIAGQVDSGGWAVRIGWFVAGLVVGMGHEQLFAGMVVVLAGWGWLLWRDGQLRFVPVEAWCGIAGLILGTMILVAAPGNYARLEAPQNEGVGIASMLLRYGMYLGGAYFGLGTGDTGRALWLGILVIALSGVLTLNGDRGKEAGIWLAASLATLAPMLPLVTFASPRTTMLAATFLVIAVLTIFPRKPGSGAPAGIMSSLVAFSLAMLVLIDGFVGWAANRSLAMEMTARVKIVQVAAAEGRKEVFVPYLATVPSRLTYMLNPEHDAEFVRKLAGRHGLATGRHDDSPAAPRPQTLNSLKALKKSF